MLAWYPLDMARMVFAAIVASADGCTFFAINGSIINNLESDYPRNEFSLHHISMDPNWELELIFCRISWKGLFFFSFWRSLALEFIFPMLCQCPELLCSITPICFSRAFGDKVEWGSKATCKHKLFPFQEIWGSLFVYMWDSVWCVSFNVV